MSTTPGYYDISVKATDSFTLNDNGTITYPSDSGTTDVYVTIASTSVTGGSSTVSVGEGVTLTANVQPSDLIPSPAPAGTFTWNIPGYAVSGYSASTSLGTVIPLSNLNGLASQSVHFYWASAGSKSVQCAISGVSCNATKTISVLSPSGANVTTTHGTIAVASGPSVARVNSGSPTLGLEGTEWTFTLPSGSPTGSYEWVQLLTSSTRTVTEGGGKIWTLYGTPYPCLDTNYPYDNVPNTGYVQGDTPGGQIYPSPTSSGVDAVFNDSFKDWLMFKPAVSDSIYVPLGVMTWNWQAHATGSLTSWTLASSSHTHSGYSASTAFPTWNRNITSNSWVHNP